jgi:hypothetical protein
MNTGTGTVAFRRAPAVRSDAESVWSAMVNATATWADVTPDLYRDLDWDKFMAAAEYHGVLPIVTQRLLESDIAATLEPEVKTRMRRMFHANLVRSVPLVDEVIRVVQEFRHKEIAIIPYKGPVLAEQLWGSSALRNCADLDFVVEPTNVNHAGEILGALGYAHVSPIAHHLRPALLRNASEEQFRHRETGLLLELQWSPAPQVFAVSHNAQEFWRRTQEVLFAGTPVLAPSPEDILVFLSIHGWKHNWSRLIWLGDVAQLVRGSDLNWDRLLIECRSNRTVRMMSLALRMMRAVFGISVPQQFEFNDPALDQLVSELEARMRRIEPCGYRDWHRCMLAARDSGFDRARQMFTFLLTPGLGEYEACELPGWAKSGYRLVRLTRLYRAVRDRRGADSSPQGNKLQTFAVIN